MKDIFIVSTDLVHTPPKVNLKNMKKYAYRCHIEMPKWVEKILKYNPGEKSLKAPFAIYLDLECLLKKEQCRKNNNDNNNNNNPGKTYTEKKAKHEPSEI